VKESAVLAVLVVSSLIVGGVVGLFILNKDPDHYKNTYYTLSYKESIGEKTFTNPFGDERTTDPTGLYTHTTYYVDEFIHGNWGSTLGSEGEFIWWDVTIEIYSKPNKVYSFGGAFIYQREMPNEIADELYMWISQTGYNNANWQPVFTTDDKGRATLTFSIGVFSDQVYAGFNAYEWGDPKTVTKL